MKYVSSGPRRVMCANDDSPFCYFGWPSIIRLPDGTLAAAASGFRFGHLCPFGKGIMMYSCDEGETWTPPAVVMDTPLDDRDCGLTCFGDGRVIVTSFNNTTAIQRKWNDKRPDGTEEERARKALISAYLDYVDALGVQKDYLGSTYRVSDDGGYTFGPVRRSPVTAPHGPCRLLDGTLLYVGRRFSEDDSFDDGKKPFIECWKMDGNGGMEQISSIENIYDEHGLLMSCEPHAIVLPDGRIVVHIRVQRSGEHNVFTVYQSVSEDGGKTFSVPEPLLDKLGGSPPHLLLHSSGVLICAYGYRNEPYGIRLMLSRNGGESWDGDWVLDDQGQSGDLGYPATVELRDGSLLTVWYENIDGVARLIQRIWRLP